MHLFDLRYANEPPLSPDVAIVRTGESHVLEFRIDGAKPRFDGFEWVAAMLGGREIAARPVPLNEVGGATTEFHKLFRYPLMLFAWDATSHVIGELYIVATGELADRDPEDPFLPHYPPDCDVISAADGSLVRMPRQFIGHVARPAAMRRDPANLEMEALDMLRSLLHGDIDELMKAALSR